MSVSLVGQARVNFKVRPSVENAGTWCPSVFNMQMLRREETIKLDLSWTFGSVNVGLTTALVWSGLGRCIQAVLISDAQMHVSVKYLLCTSTERLSCSPGVSGGGLGKLETTKSAPL